MTAPSAPQTCLFICEDPPAGGLSGAASYNRDMLRTIRALGYIVDVVVATPRLQQMRGAAVDVADVRRIDFIHGRLIGGSLRPISLPARLRWLKYWLQRVFRPRATPAATRRAWIGRHLTTADRTRIAALIADRPYDLLLVDTIFRESALDLPALPARRVLIAHDIFSQRVASFTANGFTVNAPIDTAREEAAWRRFDGIVAISPHDAAIIGAQAGVPVVGILPLVAAGEVVPASRAAGPAILYVGAAANHNIDGMRWFLDRVWPAVLERHPGATLEVVGQICDALPGFRPGVTLHGRVPDLRPIADLCRLAVSPIRMGSGIKVKMVDYFRLGLPCLATAVAADGFPLDPSPPFAVAADAPAFAATIATWLDDAAVRNEFAARIPAYLPLFSEQAARERLGELLAAIGGGDG